jgi:hypothetical protein
MRERERLQFYPERKAASARASGRASRRPHPLIVAPRDPQLARSTMRAKPHEALSPEQIMALHNRGFLTAHARRVEAAQHAFDKQWTDTDRTRAARRPPVQNHLAPLPRPRDACLLERVLQEREEGRITDQWAAGDRRAQRWARREPLPLEDCAVPRSPPRIYYYG